MLIIISEEEKTAVQDYLNHPERYLSDEFLASLSNGLPDGTKISRAKSFGRAGEMLRYYIIHASTDGKACYIPILTPRTNDPQTHSATMLNGKIYFHQNKDDLPKKLPHNFNVYCEIDEDDDPNDPDVISYIAVWARVLEKPNYVLDVTRFGLFKKTVKYAVDCEGGLFYLKSHASYVEGGMSLSTRPQGYAPEVYMGSSIFRRTATSDYIETKRIEITRDCGENLEAFMLIHRDELSSTEIEGLAREILKQYLKQISDKGIVHTDIKATNICIKKDTSAGSPFEIVFIDWEDAFDVGMTETIGNGTPGYMAPEFFNTHHDYEMQLQNRGESEGVYCDTLKSNYKSLFSTASDIYALGIVLLNDLLLDARSSLYELANIMCHKEPDRRPSAESIAGALQCRVDSSIAPGNP